LAKVRTTVESGVSNKRTRLPAGRHGLPREFVLENQRERIVTALVDTVALRGYKATTVADVTEAAGVSRRTFYEHFAGKEDCFATAYEMIAAHISDSMSAAAEVFEEWPMKVRAALATMLRFLSGEPEVAKVYALESVAAGGEISARHRDSLKGLAQVFREGRLGRDDEPPLPEVTEETLVGGVVSLIVREIVAGRTEQLGDLLPDLVELTLTPYLGAGEASRLARAESVNAQTGVE
jgi:AcrR family transcriptional regulator